jgi:hypothetical protein
LSCGGFFSVGRGAGLSGLALVGGGTGRGGGILRRRRLGDARSCEEDDGQNDAGCGEDSHWLRLWFQFFDGAGCRFVIVSRPEVLHGGANAVLAAGAVRTSLLLFYSLELI